MERILEEVKRIFAKDASGHDYYHTLRVYHTAMRLAQEESCNQEVVALAAILHDVDDKKLFATENYENARSLLQLYGATAVLTEQVIEAISTVSYRGSSVKPSTVEGQIVQDADRLDALGAIGIARAFAYGGSHGRAIYDPENPPRRDMTPQEYQQNRGSSLNHFYEKLFLLKDTMNTASGRKMAAHRDAFLRCYVEEFLAEWEGVK